MIGHIFNRIKAWRGNFPKIFVLPYNSLNSSSFKLQQGMIFQEQFAASHHSVTGQPGVETTLKDKETLTLE